MQFIRDIHSARTVGSRPVLSFEFYPPKTPEGERALYEKTIPALKQLNPDFFSVTYGAGGSTREKTLSIVSRIQEEHGVTAMAHLTCVGARKTELKEVIEEARGLGIKNILALRGDPPSGHGAFQPTDGGLAYASELVTLLKEMGGFSIGTAGFPEGHLACREGKEVDWKRLKTKIDCGADFVLTQLFYDNSDFFEFRKYLTQLGVTVPICPGVLPILNTGQIKRFAGLCGARIPPQLLETLESLKDNDSAVAELGIDLATQQCRELLRENVPGLHFYTLNKAHSVSRIIRNLGLAE